MSNKLKYIFFTYDGSALAVAKKLVDEGNAVITAQIRNASELHNGMTEDRDSRNKRLSLYDGMLDKRDARDVLRSMAKMRNKDDYFVIFDLNSLWFYAQAARKLGFTKGFFPTREDTEYEDIRAKGKELAKQFWPDLTVAEVHSFKKADEGIAFLEEHAEDMFVLKANAEGDLTVVPQSDDADIARENLIGALNAKRGEYESMGYILELKITNPIEITPQLVFYDGKPVFSDICIENKPIGAGSIGNMTGCSGNLVFKTKLSDEINRIAFPPKVYEMAKAHPGMFVWDASLLIDERTRKIYFGEFCPNRWGYDSFFTEIAMSEGASAYFEAIVAGRNPLRRPYGAAVRLFNLKHFADAIISVKSEDGIFMYDVRRKDGQLVSGGADWNLLAATGAGSTPEKAVAQAYETMKNVSFTDGYYRPQFDFECHEYQTSIPNRYDFANGWLYEAKEWTTEDVGRIVERIGKRHENTASNRIMTLMRKHAEAMSAAEEKHKADMEALRTSNRGGSGAP
jgi:hypothetical protein